MSLEYLALRGTATKSTLANYFAAVRETEDARRDENWAACTIARVWKGYFARKYIAYINEQACTIQRIYRGYVGRIVCERKRQDKIHAIEREYYDSCAVKIQKLFKGYLSRRDKEDFYKRKKWIAHVREKGQELRRQMDEHVDQQIAYNQEKSDYASTLEFEKLTSNLHHLVGTKCTPGVFSSRWGPDFDTTAYGKEMGDV